MTAFKRHGAWIVCALFLFAAACGDKGPAGNGGDEAANEEDHEHSGKHGGQVVESSDHSAHFEIVHDEEEGVAMLYLYDGKMKPVKSAAAPVLNVMVDDEPVSIKGTGAAPGGEWAFVHEALKAHVHGRFRVEIGGKTYTPEFDPGHDDDHGHEHEDGHKHDDGGDDDHAGHGPHDGMVAAFEGGFVELKLHDDKGDLELWIAKDKGITEPFDLALTASVTVTFLDRDNKQVTLRVRNTDKNEDEDGKANNRDGKTNYFIFPGDSGADAKWLMGAEFKAKVRVAFHADGKRRYTEGFLLRPHTHGEHGHDHK